jgi:hypothetical protein
MEQRGQATVFIAILALMVGIVAFVVIYGMNSRQNAELANTVAESITISEPVIEDAYMETLAHAAKRHGPIVYTIAQQCNSKSGNAQIRLHWNSPKGPRNAYACFLEGSWWVTVEGSEVEGDNIVTVFPRKSAQRRDRLPQERWVRRVMSNGKSKAAHRTGRSRRRGPGRGG